LRTELRAGDILSGRFVVEARAGSGGMGVVYRARDQACDEPVAIKVVDPEDPDHLGRFAQEGLLLARLSHPSIVRYVAHGTSAEGAPFIAMEWLDGEDLSSRLLRSPLRIDETLTLIRRACEGIAVAHASGVVHRDLKPSNLFLVHGDPSSVKVLDFGIARDPGGARQLTQTGMFLGTVGYMSPEQAMGPREVDSRTDVFALGCVLFECLTGRAAFVGHNAVAVLAKVLREDPPRLKTLCSGIGHALETLVERMLAKNREHRPKDAGAVLRALEAISVGAGTSPPSARPQSGVTAREQNIVSVILGQRRATANPEGSALETEVDASRVREVTDSFGAEFVPMRDGGVLVVFQSSGAAIDQARQAARCALLLHRSHSEMSFSVATGRAETTGPIPVGAAIDKAAELLTRTNAASGGIALDSLTADLLDPSFEVRREGVAFALVGRAPELEAPRQLMGKPSPFVGREKELGLLHLTLEECIENSVARAVLVVGPPGQGKSRLRHEFVAKVADSDAARILFARADPIGARAPFALASQLVRKAVRLREPAPPEERARLRAYLGRAGRGVDAMRCADFLGELIGLPRADAASPELHAARHDPQIMSTWLERSFADWLAIECATGPLLLVVEDLHWGDQTSVTYLGQALRSSGKALMILALGRTELRDTFPNLWREGEGMEIPLGGLTPRAAERLVREVLSQEPGNGVVRRVVDLAAGNAFYLEELIRHAAERKAEGFPETVVSLAQSRLERLRPEARQLVRAASVFGEVFWSGAALAVLGDALDAGELEVLLTNLVQDEVFVAAEASRFTGEREYAFRHGLLREAAYAMLTDDDRATAHRIAAEWLERAGEKDALTIGNHFELGDAPRRAVPWLRVAAQAAVGCGDLDLASRLCRRASDAGADGVEKGLLELAQAQACGLRGEWQASTVAHQHALELLQPGTTDWFVAVGGILASAAFTGDLELTLRTLQAVSSVRAPSERTGSYGFAVYCVTQGMAATGQPGARSFLEQAEAMLADDASSVDPLFVMWLRLARTLVDVMRAELGDALVALSEARAIAERTGAVLGRAVSGMYFVQFYAETGLRERAEAIAGEVLALCETTGLRLVAEWTTYYVSWARIATGHAAQAVEPLRGLEGSTDLRLATAVKILLSVALLATESSEFASRVMGFSAESLPFPSNRAAGFGVQALAALRAGLADEALELTERGLEAAAIASYPFTSSTLRLTRAEALLSLGRSAEARLVLVEARDRIVHIATALTDPDVRQAYLTNVIANQRTLALAEACLRDE
jgi:hypothetical protein